MNEAAASVRSALALAWTSLAVFLVLFHRQLTAAAAVLKGAQGAAAGAAKNIATPPARQADAKALVDSDPAKLLESAAKLVDSLTKAGPGLVALGVGSSLAIVAYGIQKPERRDVTSQRHIDHDRDRSKECARQVVRHSF